MRKYLRKILAVGFSILGTLLAIYVGGYWLFLRPVRSLFVAFTSGALTKNVLVICVVKIFLASTAGGGIWCICDIIAGKFRDEE